MNANRGFTLVEILIALMIFSVISVLAYRATAALTDGELRLTQEAAHWRAIEQVFTRLEADVRQALPRPLAEGGHTLPPWRGQHEPQRRVELQFARAAPGLPTTVSTARGQRMAYVWQRNENGGALELLYWPAFDNLPNTAPQRYLLLDGIAYFRLDYLSRNGDWIDEWPPADKTTSDAPLPRAVRVQLAAADGAVVERLFALQ
ncbi:MAG: type II secretion system minor pseudopilin GspJ [Proteobacteria bacterium]|nr:type II secretion system minor pseudopilin GspJ [Pseudomonadota bacterium]MCL2306971.1 type II secretion system minor pseudopilin GspJ [Pseudomonadota bacterium]